MAYSNPVQRVLAALPATKVELVKKLHVSRTTIGRWVNAMHGPLCHIGSWSVHEAENNWLPVYHAGKGKDKPCRFVQATRAARHQKVHANPEAHERHKASRRARYWAKKAEKRGDPLMSTFFGVAK